TYIRIKGGWCYLAVVIDLYSRNIVGFSVAHSPDSELTSKALMMAYESRLKPENILFHSDQGTHYTSQRFADELSRCKGMQHSMSRKGNCWDNAPTERFFRSYKSEWMPKNGYDSKTDAINDITDYIWGYYRGVRPHKHNDYLTPFEKEKRFLTKTS
ncbi:MAG: IS3 family transposase, partial [Moraxellaceae bacterium]|nr:IS3 family transposase [Moraxellaceae bacterium]